MNAHSLFRLVPVVCTAAVVTAVAMTLPVHAQDSADPELPVAAVSDSAHDFGHPPAGAVDGDPDTMWYSAGDPQWLRIDLRHPAVPSAVEISWLDGDQQFAEFHVELSVDGRTWTPVDYGNSSGRSTGPERYEFSGQTACALRVVVHGTSNNNWNGIDELRAFGTPSTGSCDTAPAPPYQPPSPTPVTKTAGSDPFGVSEIYRTAPHGERWFMNMDHADQDPRFDPQHPITRNPDGSWGFTDPTENHAARLGVFTSSGYHKDRVVTNQSTLAARGYMQDRHDWKNVEMTGYVLLNSATDDDQFDWYARGGHHSNPKPFCEGTAYKGDLYYDGRARGVKEQFHTAGYAFTNSIPAVAGVQGHWVGFKVVLYNLEEAGETHVRMQLFVDADADNHWLKVYDMVDRGAWGKKATVCGALHPDQIITWGGPIATFRWDNATDVAWKWLSVREIASPR